MLPWEDLTGELHLVGKVGEGFAEEVTFELRFEEWIGVLQVKREEKSLPYGSIFQGFLVRFFHT